MTAVLVAEVAEGNLSGTVAVDLPFHETFVVIVVDAVVVVVVDAVVVDTVFVNTVAAFVVAAVVDAVAAENVAVVVVVAVVDRGVVVVFVVVFSSSFQCEEQCSWYFIFLCDCFH